eukprot:scaffold39294_cov34-Tisochrysis_lutea.AAC.2
MRKVERCYFSCPPPLPAPYSSCSPMTWATLQALLICPAVPQAHGGSNRGSAQQRNPGHSARDCKQRSFRPRLFLSETTHWLCPPIGQ